jgi:hypothetical protein
MRTPLRTLILRSNLNQRCKLQNDCIGRRFVPPAHKSMPRRPGQ